MECMTFFANFSEIKMSYFLKYGANSQSNDNYLRLIEESRDILKFVLFELLPSNLNFFFEISAGTVHDKCLGVQIFFPLQNS